MEYLSTWISSLLYTAFGGMLELALIIFFVACVIQYYRHGSIDGNKAAGSVSKVAVATTRFIASLAKRRR